MEGIKARIGDHVEVKYPPWVSPALEYTLIGKSAFPNGLKVEYFGNANLSGTFRISSIKCAMFITRHSSASLG